MLRGSRRHSRFHTAWTHNGGGAAGTPCAGCPIRSRGAHSRTGKDRAGLESVNVPVVLGRVRVELGDMVAADDSCVVVVTRLRPADVLRAAAEIVAKEDPILRDVRAGTDLAEARRRHGWHTPQSRGA
jgi:regulator of RNase E activity RraA